MSLIALLRSITSLSIDDDAIRVAIESARSTSIGPLDLVSVALGRVWSDYVNHYRSEM